VFAFGSLLAAAVFAAAKRVPATGDRDSAPLIRTAFLLFAAILLSVGVALILNLPHVFPIPLTPDMAAVYGWFFLGSFAYYLYGFWTPSRLNTTGQLLSFLVYDLLMLPPYLHYWKVVEPRFTPGLLVYLGVLLGSAAFCLYALLVDPRSRLVRGRVGIPVTRARSG
jgi:hypothetical protein